MYDAIYTEQSGKPAVLLANQDFATDARSAASSRGMPTLRIIGEPVPPECTVSAKIEAGIDSAMNEILAALTRLTGARTIICTAVTGDGGRVVSYDRLIAICRIGGVSLADLMHRAGQPDGGRGLKGR